MSARRLVELTDNLWVDPIEVVAVRGARADSGTYLVLTSGDQVHTALDLAAVLEALGVGRKAPRTGTEKRALI